MVRPTASDEHAVVAARRLRRVILRQLGLAAPLLLEAGCTQTQPSTDEGGVTTNQSSGSEESPDSGETPDPEESSDGEATDADTGMPEDSGSMDESESDGGVKFDMMSIPDGPPVPQCSSWELLEEEVAATFPDCMLGPFDPRLGVVYNQICVEPPADGDCSAICPPEMLCEGMQDCSGPPEYGVCGPYQTEDGCCLLVPAEDFPVPGRPFSVEGSIQFAIVADVPRERDAAHWLAVARGEHASVAAFARFVAVLQRFAAPARMVAEAIAAAADEVRHAEQTLALASDACGRQLELGPLAVADAMRGTDDLAAALRAAVREGCIDETLSAHEAACMAADAKDPNVASVLEQIAADEARHAALAWKFVAWVLAQRPELRSIVVETFASAAAPRTRVRRVGMRELVEPCAARLLAIYA